MNVLKTKIELRYGKTITFSAECNKLASHIYHAIGVKISAQTLRRVLGFIKDGSKPGKSTLKVICDYCNIEHVEELFSNNESKLSAIDIEQINFLKSFYDIDLSSDYDFNYHKACGNIARKIINQPNYLEALSGFLTNVLLPRFSFSSASHTLMGLQVITRNILSDMYKVKKNMRRSFLATVFCL